MRLSICEGMENDSGTHDEWEECGKTEGPWIVCQLILKDDTAGQCVIKKACVLPFTFEGVINNSRGVMLELCAILVRSGLKCCL